MGEIPNFGEDEPLLSAAMLSSNVERNKSMDCFLLNDPPSLSQVFQFRISGFHRPGDQFQVRSSKFRVRLFPTFFEEMTYESNCCPPVRRS